MSDTAPACGLIAAYLLIHGPTGGRPESYLWWTATAVMAAAVALRRYRPVVMLVVCTLAGVVHLALEAPTVVDLGVPLLLGTVAARCRRGTSLAALCGLLLVVGGWCASYAARGRPVPGLPVTAVHIDKGPGPPYAPADLTRVDEGQAVGPWTALVVVVLALLAAWAAGTAVRDRLAYLGQLRARMEDLEHERDRQAALAAMTERARISREMHDVVAHGLSVIVLQAQVAAVSLDDPPQEARAALDTIVTIGRESLTDMREVLTAVGDAEDAWFTPPRLDQLPALLSRVHRAGTRARLRVEGTPTVLPSSVDLAAYRIVQEALTNTIKHAGPGATAEVLVDHGATEVRIEVRDDGGGVTRTSPDDRKRHSGLGLRGMRERVALLGGHFTAGQGADGGFTVRAVLPLRHPGRTPPERVAAGRTAVSVEGQTL
ncbi:sensor histidine kinase [Streptomyces sp. RFCAC02]|uniref:sensor histidine kinase n=1 Tax=Streptomyces sp. RFCAC02 TaxID=2499143 RepID=UPI0019D23724|nr:sensor histidine kinase [Streptomyces sp. RFCAC02]